MEGQALIPGDRQMRSLMGTSGPEQLYVKLLSAGGNMSGLHTQGKKKIRFCQKFLSFTGWKARALPRAGNEHVDVPLK